MAAIQRLVRTRREAFVGELTEAALAVLAQHHVAGRSVELELELWQRLAVAVDHLPRSHDWEHRLGVLTRAAYEVALAHGFAGVFIELEMDLWARLRGVVRRNRFLPERTYRAARLSGMLDLR